MLQLFKESGLLEAILALCAAVLTAVATVIGGKIKSIYTEKANTKEKQAVVALVVQGIEQMYKELKGPEKLQKALDAAAEILQEKGINVTEFELRMLIESTVGAFNNVFAEDNLQDGNYIPAEDLYCDEQTKEDDTDWESEQEDEQ